MLSKCCSSYYSTRIAEMQEKGHELMLNSCLAKMHNSLVMRETVALARETCGGKGVTILRQTLLVSADAESILVPMEVHTK